MNPLNMAPRNQINEKISVSDFILPVENLEVSYILLEREREREHI